MSLYANIIASPGAQLSRLSDWMDRHVWDGLVRGFGGARSVLWNLYSKSVDERGINAGVDESDSWHSRSGSSVVRGHSGQIQTYLGVVAVGMLALLILYAWLA